MSSKKGFGRLYDRLTPEERFRLDVLALSRGDEEGSERLTATCPRRGYTMNDWGFVGRWEAARELAMLAYVDVVRRLDKIKMIGAFRDLFPYLGNIWQDGVNAFTSFPCPVEFPDGAVFFSPALGRQAGITVRLCERSLTRVFGSVTLAMDKARKGA